jgi:hypothetical protein
VLNEHGDPAAGVGTAGVAVAEGEPVEGLRMWKPSSVSHRVLDRDLLCLLRIWEHGGARRDRRGRLCAPVQLLFRPRARRWPASVHLCRPAARPPLFLGPPPQRGGSDVVPASSAVSDCSSTWGLVRSSGPDCRRRSARGRLAGRSLCREGAGVLPVPTAPPPNDVHVAQQGGWRVVTVDRRRRCGRSTRASRTAPVAGQAMASNVVRTMAYRSRVEQPRRRRPQP